MMRAFRFYTEKAPAIPSCVLLRFVALVHSTRSQQLVRGWNKKTIGHRNVVFGLLETEYRVGGKYHHRFGKYIEKIPNKNNHKPHFKLKNMYIYIYNFTHIKEQRGVLVNHPRNTRCYAGLPDTTTPHSVSACNSTPRTKSIGTAESIGTGDVQQAGTAALLTACKVGYVSLREEFLRR